MTAPIAIAAPAAAPAAPSTPVTPKNGAHTEAGQPPATDPKVNAKANTEPGAKAGETAAETRQRMKLKLRKLDGPGEEELDLDEHELGRFVQKARVADRTRGEFDKRVQEWEAREKAALENPLAFFKERGVDLVELGKQEAARAEELAKLDPVQRELAETRAERDALKQADAKRAEQAKADAEAHEARQYVLQEQALYKQAIVASGRAPKTPAEAGYLMRLYADVREMAEHAGIPLTGEQLSAAGDKLELSRFKSMTKRLAADPKWRGKNMTELKALAEAITTGMDDGALMEFFGPKTATRLARAQLASYRKSPIPLVADGQTEQPAPSTRPPQGRPEESIMGMLDGLSNRG